LAASLRSFHACRLAPISPGPHLPLPRQAAAHASRVTHAIPAHHATPTRRPQEGAEPVASLASLAPRNASSSRSSRRRRHLAYQRPRLARCCRLARRSCLARRRLPCRRCPYRHPNRRWNRCAGPAVGPTTSIEYLKRRTLGYFSSEGGQSHQGRPHRARVRRGSAFAIPLIFFHPPCLAAPPGLLLPVDRGFHLKLHDERKQQ
jgi:hypothetical protein